MIADLKEVWVVKGEMTDAQIYGPEYKNGDPEWQFSDAPPDNRYWSADFATLEEGLRMFSGKIINFVE